MSTPSDELVEQFEREANEAHREHPLARKVSKDTITGVIFPPDPSPELHGICAFGPCIYYATQVVHVPTANEEQAGDGIAHAERTHWCEHFKRDLGGDWIFDCSRWEAGWRADVPRLTKDTYLAKIRVQPADPNGYYHCRVCTHSRERSGVPDIAARQASGMPPQAFCWCGEKAVPDVWSEP